MVKILLSNQEEVQPTSDGDLSRVPYRDRVHAGQTLAKILRAYANRVDVLVLAAHWAPLMAPSRRASIAQALCEECVMRQLSCWFVAYAMSLTACHPGPVLDTGPKPPSVGGTVAGLVMTADATVAVPTRKVTVIETTTGSRYDATTAANGGYTIQVPEGTYRIEVELRAGEVLTKQPDPTLVTNGDLDTGRDFVIAVKPPGSAASP